MTYNITINNYGMQNIAYGNGATMPGEMPGLQKPNDFMKKLFEMYQKPTSPNLFKSNYESPGKIDKNYLKNLPALISIIESYDRSRTR